MAPKLQQHPLNLLCFAVLSETGGICISPKPSEPDAEIIPGMAMRPFFGIKPVLLDAEVRGSSVGVGVGAGGQTNPQEKADQDYEAAPTASP